MDTSWDRYDARARLASMLNVTISMSWVGSASALRIFARPRALQVRGDDFRHVLK